MIAGRSLRFRVRPCLLLAALALLGPAAPAPAQQLGGTLREVRIRYTGGCINQTDTTFADTVSSSASGSDTKSLSCYGSSGSLTVSWSVPATLPAADPFTPYTPPLPFTITSRATWTTPPAPFHGPPYQLTVTAGNNSAGCFAFVEDIALPAGTHTRTATKSCTIGLAPAGIGTQSMTSLQAGLSAGSSWGFISGNGQATYDVAFAGPAPRISPGVASNGGLAAQPEPLTATITGAGFVTGSTVKIGDVTILATRVKSATQIEVDLGGFSGLPNGSRDVEIKAPSGTSRVEKDLFYVTDLAALLEVNQGVPMACTTAEPCVASHDTVVRARISCRAAGCETDRERVTGFLHIEKDGAPYAKFRAEPDTMRVLPTYTGTMTKAEQIRRFKAQDALNFYLLNPDLPDGTYTLTFELDPRHPGTLPQASALDLEKNLVRRLGPLAFKTSVAPVRRVGVFVEGNGRADFARALESFQFLRATYPVSRDRIKPIPLTGTHVYIGVPFTLLGLANERRIPGIASAISGGLWYESLLLFTPGPGSDARGATDANADGATFVVNNPVSIIRFPALTDPEASIVPKTVAHEMGHQLRLGDTYLDGPQVSPFNHPDAPGANCPKDVGSGCLVEEGHFDTELKHVSTSLAPDSSAPRLSTQFFDFMGSAWRIASWVDLRTWKFLYTHFMTTGASQRAQAEKATGDWIWVSGTVGPGDAAAFAPFLRYSGENFDDTTPGGPYTLELQGASGAVLASANLPVVFQAGHMTAPASAGVFSRTLPFPAGVARIVLKSGGRELVSRSVSARPPSVTITFPAGGETLSGTATLRWTGSDADGDALTYDVLASPDGTTWNPLATGVTANQLAWDTTLSAGSPTSRIQVVANDGVNQTRAVSAAFTVAKGRPIAAIASPANAALVLYGDAVTLRGFGWDPEDGELTGSALTFASSRDGVLGTGDALVTSRLSAGAHTITLTARDRDGNTSTASSSLTVFQAPPSPSATAFVPIVLSTAGLNGAFFTSELTLTNRGGKDAVVELVYTSAFGGGEGSAFVALPAGRQKIVPDAVEYLTSLGVPLPASGNRGGTVSVRFYGLNAPADGSATVRTTTAVPQGRAGLSYPATPPALLTGPVIISGLRQTGNDRSNVAVQNAGQPSDGTIVLRLTVFSGDPARPGSKILPDIGLPPGGFAQVSAILASNGLDFTNGYVKVERVAGTAPYYAYGVVNDQVTSDGSFVPPFAVNALAGKSGLTIPVIVETATFSSELVATNSSGTAKTVRFSFLADAVSTADRTATFSLTLAPGEQRVIPALVQYLRDQHVTGVGASGPTYSGALFAAVESGDANGLILGVRTSAPAVGGEGRFGLFYMGVPNGAAATGSAWVYGLQQNGENRSNLAIVNTGEVENAPASYRVEIYDGDSGVLVKTLEASLPARRFVQLSGILNNAPFTTNGYVRVVRTSGNNPFIAYAVVNDGGAPGERSGDGAFVGMDRTP